MSEPRSDAERIVVFLGENDDRTWGATTIAERLDSDADGVNAVLSRLKERGLVCREGSHWRITRIEARMPLPQRATIGSE
ncbi:MarR family transcriptional regulator [Halobacteriales archaeon SW_8_68_21]|nr:MAG: MarR family transcriptional regulator [Halobacteriales archaeon SW_8_68_21]